MPWQKVVGHINDETVRVESKDGNQYPARTEYDWLNDSIYTQQVNSNDSRTLWAWVNFDDGEPVVEDTSFGDPQGGPPSKPPWER